jgi:GNAT superfamily N-acetyltransferase
MGYELVLSDTADEGKRRLVGRGLAAYNAAASEHLRVEYASGHWGRPLDIYLVDEQGATLGGLVAYTIWGWLVLDDLWLGERVRRQGYGRELMRRAEEEARARGCTQAQTHTFSFQARGFYEKLGYRLIGEVRDWPPGHSFYWLTKDLRTGKMST